MPRQWTLIGYLLWISLTLGGCAADRVGDASTSADVSIDTSTDAPLVREDSGTDTVDDILPDLVCGIELCNGVDDDCDDRVDEGTQMACTSSSVTAIGQCEFGACTMRCVPGFVDTNGVLDDGCECLEGRANCDSCDAIAACVPGEPTQYPISSPASLLDSIEIELEAEVGDDFNGDGIGDNALGPLMDALFPLLDRDGINTWIESAITNHELGLALIAPEWGSAQAELHLVQVGFFEADDVVYIKNTTFITGSATPRHRFAELLLRDESITAIGGRLPLGFSVEGLRLDITLEQATLRGELRTDIEGLRLRRGVLTGAVLLDDLLESFNRYLRSRTCACLSMQEAHYLLSPTTGEVECSATVVDTMACEAEEGTSLCVQIAQLCGAVGLVLTSSADLDLNGDGRNESMSATIALEGRGVRLEGIGF